MSHLFPFLVSLAVALLTTMVVTPWEIVLARKIGAIDHPDARKAHSSPTPRLGGVAIAAGFAVGMAVLLTMDPSMARTWVAGAQGLAFALALGGMLILGVMDDIKSMGPGRKFLVQLLLATVVYVDGFRISFERESFSGSAKGCFLHPRDDLPDSRDQVKPTCCPKKTWDQENS